MLNGTKQNCTHIKMEKSLKPGDKAKKITATDRIGGRRDPFDRAERWAGKKRNPSHMMMLDES